jgi:CheY-like chemotaxis protein
MTLLEKSPLRILVVDDQTDCADIFGLLLRVWGYDVRVAYSGKAALDLVQEQSPHVIFLDIGMPKMDGYELAVRLRQQANMSEVTLIAVTGYADEPHRARSREAGFDHYLVKPIDAGNLEGILKHISQATDQGSPCRPQPVALR